MCMCMMIIQTTNYAISTDCSTNSRTLADGIVLYCIVLYCIVLYCIVLYSIVFYCVAITACITC